MRAGGAVRSGNRSRYFIRIDAPVRRSLGEIARFAIRQRGMRAAFLALGQALVNAISIRLVFDDENTAVRRCGRSGTEERAGQNRGER